MSKRIMCIMIFIVLIALFATGQTSRNSFGDPFYPREDYINFLKELDTSDAEVKERLMTAGITITDAHLTEIAEFTQELTKDIKTPYQKYVAVYTWIINNISYDYPLSNEPYEVFTTKIAVCDGYAGLLTTMLRTINILSTTAYGHNGYEGHAWNVVYTPEYGWFYSDPTTTTTSMMNSKIEGFEDFWFRHSTHGNSAIRVTQNGYYISFFKGYTYMGDRENREVIEIPTHFEGVNNRYPITRIDESAFNDRIRELSIPATVSYMPYSEYFTLLTNLASITVDEANENYRSIDGVLYTADLNSLIVFPAKLNLKELALPDEITSLEKELFRNSIYLEDITTSNNSVYSSYDGVLYDNSFASVQYIPSGKRTVAIHESAGGVMVFPYHQLENLSFDEGFNSFTYSSVSSETLKRVKIPNSATDIPNGLFGDVILYSDSDFAREYADANGLEIRSAVQYAIDIAGDDSGNTDTTSYTITYMIEDMVYSTATFRAGDAVTHPQPEEKQGFTFKWNTNITTMPAQNITVVGIYTEQTTTYTITYMIEDTVFKVENLNAGAAVVYPTVEEKSGFTFAWNTSITTMPAQNITVVGTYSGSGTTETFTITYFIDDEVYSTAILSAGDEVVFPEVDEKPGFVFEWNSSVETMPEQDLIIIGEYKPDAVGVLTNGTVKRHRFAISDRMIIAEDIQFPANVQFISFNGKVAYSTAITSRATALPKMAAGVYVVRFESKTMNQVIKSVIK